MTGENHKPETLQQATGGTWRGLRSRELNPQASRPPVRFLCKDKLVRLNYSLVFDSKGGFNEKQEDSRQVQENVHSLRLPGKMYGRCPVERKSND